MTYGEFLARVAKRLNTTDERYGQALFNQLSIDHPDLAAEIRGSIIDPFHKDDPSHVTFTIIEDRWNE